MRDSRSSSSSTYTDDSSRDSCDSSTDDSSSSRNSDDSWVNRLQQGKDLFAPKDVAPDERMRSAARIIFQSFETGLPAIKRLGSELVGSPPYLAPEAISSAIYLADYGDKFGRVGDSTLQSIFEALSEGKILKHSAVKLLLNHHPLNSLNQSAEEKIVVSDEITDFVDNFREQLELMKAAAHKQGSLIKQ